MFYEMGCNGWRLSLWFTWFENSMARVAILNYLDRFPIARFGKWSADVPDLGMLPIVPSR